MTSAASVLNRRHRAHRLSRSDRHAPGSPRLGRSHTSLSSARAASVAAGHVGFGSGRLLAVTPRLVAANHLPHFPENRAHRADRRDRHLPATMTTSTVDGDEKGDASHAVDSPGDGNRPSPSHRSSPRTARVANAESSGGGGKRTGLSASHAATTTPCFALRFQTGRRTSGVDAHLVHALQGFECREKTHRLKSDPVDVMAAVWSRHRCNRGSCDLPRTPIGPVLVRISSRHHGSEGTQRCAFARACDLCSSPTSWLALRDCPPTPAGQRG